VADRKKLDQNITQSVKWQVVRQKRKEDMIRLGHYLRKKKRFEYLVKLALSFKFIKQYRSKVMLAVAMKEI
jgi:hypothetical protein